MVTLTKKLKPENLYASIVIPNWNGRDLLERNLPSIIKAKRNKRNNIREIIIVDDKSSDDSVEFLERHYSSEIRPIRHRENRGFSVAINTGARMAKGQLICLLNSDVIPSADFLEAAIPHFKDKKVFAVSLHEKGYGYAKGRFRNGFIEHDPGEEASVPKLSFWASGGSAVFRRSYWMKLKGFDDHLFKFYWEDVDLSYRAQKRGFSIIWEPKSRVVHEHESTTSKAFTKRQMMRMQEKNQLLFIWKNLTSPNLFRRHVRGLFKRIIRNPGYIRVFVSALIRIRQLSKRRKTEKRDSVISDEAIFASFKES